MCIRDRCNRDCELEFVHTPYALDPRERFLGYGRGKTVVPGEQIGTNVRPLVGVATPDLKAIHPLPHGNTISPLPAPEVHAMRSLVYGPDLIGLLVEFYGRDLRVFTSEDGVNFQQLAGDIIQCGQLPGEPTDLAPGVSFCIGKWRLYYYGGGDFLNLAATERNRESCYGLAEGKLTGLLETAMLERPDVYKRQLIYRQIRRLIRRYHRYAQAVPMDHGPGPALHGPGQRTGRLR